MRGISVQCQGSLEQPEIWHLKYYVGVFLPSFKIKLHLLHLTLERRCLLRMGEHTPPPYTALCKDLSGAAQRLQQVAAPHLHPVWSPLERKHWFQRLSPS